MTSSLYTTSEVAEILGVTANTIRGYIHRGILPTKGGSKRRIPDHAVMEYLLRRKAKKQ